MTARLQPSALFVLLPAMTLLWGCSSSDRARSQRSVLDDAIALYIDRDYTRAEARLREITESPEPGDDLIEAYLYLGRTYLAVRDYERAAEAFSTGRMLGGGPQFDAYLAEAQGHLRATPRIVRGEPTVTRGELAALIDAMFAADVAEPHAGESAADADAHWASSHIQSVRQAGFMNALPDGRFHPDREVTRAAFYVVVLRVAQVIGADARLAHELFPLGFRGAAADTEEDLVSGREVVEAFETLAAGTDR